MSRGELRNSRQFAADSRRNAVNGRVFPRPGRSVPGQPTKSFRISTNRLWTGRQADPVELATRVLLYSALLTEYVVVARVSPAE